MKTKLSLSVIFTLVFIINGQSGFCQFWHSYNPFIWFDVNSVDIPAPGVIAAGGGHETIDSIQIMFQSVDYGATWNENTHDGLIPWNKSIAFSDALNGYGVGDNGRIIKTTDAGLNWGWPVSPIDRTLNKIFYAGAGRYYAAGGNKANDSTQTILKSSDFGNTWSVKLDASGPWLKSIYFIDTLKGFAVGNSGVIISSMDGGNSWTSVTAPLQMDFNALTFINSDTGYIVGGTSSGQCHRTILRTVNGGSAWSVLADTIGGILKDISFADARVGYAVGDNATVMKTTDGGLNWSHIVIDTNLTGNESFNAVKFANQNMGVIGGKGGLLYVYYDPYPIISTLPATEISPISANLNGTINSNGDTTALSFEYGTTTAYGNELNAVPDTFSGVGSINLNAVLSGLTPNTTYHFRIHATNSKGTYYGMICPFIRGCRKYPILILRIGHLIH